MKLKFFAFLLSLVSVGVANAQQIQWCQVRLADNAVSTCYGTRDNCMLFNRGSEQTYACVAIQK